MLDFDRKFFLATSSTANAEVNSDTIFRFRQKGDLVWATYEGGGVRFGHMLGTVSGNGSHTVHYHHVNTEGELVAGSAAAVAEQLPDGRLRLHERWSSDTAKGEFVIDEVAPRE